MYFGFHIRWAYLGHLNINEKGFGDILASAYTLLLRLPLVFATVIWVIQTFFKLHKLQKQELVWRNSYFMCKDGVQVHSCWKMSTWTTHGGRGRGSITRLPESIPSEKYSNCIYDKYHSPRVVRIIHAWIRRDVQVSSLLRPRVVWMEKQTANGVYNKCIIIISRQINYVTCTCVTTLLFEEILSLF